MSNDKLPWRQLSNDLYCDVRCECGERMKLIGYADSYFFDVVNKDVQRRSCACGRTVDFRWTRDGVQVFTEATQ